MTHKYRPAFTSAQLARMATLVELSDHLEDLQIKRIVVPLLAKISYGTASPAYTPLPANIAKIDAARELARYNNDEMSEDESSIYERDVLGF